MPQKTIATPAPVKAKVKGSAFTSASKLNEDTLDRLGFKVQRAWSFEPKAEWWFAYCKGIRVTDEDGLAKRFFHKKQALTFIRREERKGRAQW